MNTMLRDNLEQQMRPTFPFHLKEKVEQSDPVTRYADRPTERADFQVRIVPQVDRLLTMKYKPTWHISAALTHKRGRHYHRTGSVGVQFSRSRGSFGADESHLHRFSWEYPDGTNCRSTLWSRCYQPAAESDVDCLNVTTWLKRPVALTELLKFVLR